MSAHLRPRAMVSGSDRRPRASATDRGRRPMTLAGQKPAAGRCSGWLARTHLERCTPPSGNAPTLPARSKRMGRGPATRACEDPTLKACAASRDERTPRFVALSHATDRAATVWHGNGLLKAYSATRDSAPRTHAKPPESAQRSNEKLFPETKLTRGWLTDMALSCGQQRLRGRASTRC
jgi:hypothetical protein